MPRELRPRKPRKSYADIAGNGIEDNDNAAGPSNIHLEDEEHDSESGFEPDKDPKGANKVPSSDEDEDDVAMDDIQEPGSEMEVEETPKQRRKTASSSKPPRAPIGTSATYPGSPTMSVSLKTRNEQSRRLPPRVQQATCAPSEAIPPVAAPRVAKTYALPSPSAHHRHRAIPVFFREETVERLDELPALFKEPRIVPTNSMTADHSLTNRVSKAWGFNVGAGPVWQIMEDRSCYKESISPGPGPEKESLRRPRVYQNVSVRPGWKVLISRDALKYLPTDSTMTEDGQFKPPPQVDCYLGPCDRQTRVSFNMFDSVATSTYFEDGAGYVFNAGSPVWGIDWCPTYQADRPVRQFRHYLAVAPFPSRSHAPSIGVKIARPPACVQIWALKPRTREDNTMDDDRPQSDPAEVRCEMVLCLESGSAQEIKWCPLPAHDPWEGAPPRNPRRLGILAGTFEDGSLSIYVVPDPDDVRPPEHDAARPIFVRLPEPALRIEHEGASCWSLDWANSEVIAVGLTNGCLAVYNVKQALESGETSNIFPTHFIAIHQSAIRALAWIRVPPTDGSGVPNLSEDPTVIASGGYDGVECLTDIREPHGNVVNRTRDVINSATYSVFATGPIMIDHDNTVKSYSVSPSMLGRGHILMEPDGPVWSVDASDYHPQLAVGSADGSCTTTNTLKSTRRGGIVPFLVHKIYQLDYSRKTGEFRMLERFLPQVTSIHGVSHLVALNRAPQEMQDKTTSAKGKAQGKDKHKDKQDADADAETKGRSTNTGVWPPEIGVHRVAWNNGNGLGGAPLLASATASGLCRVDWLLGRWIKDRTPYVSISKMRKEVEGASDESDEEV